MTTSNLQKDIIPDALPPVALPPDSELYYISSEKDIYYKIKCRDDDINIYICRAYADVFKSR